MRLGGCRQFLFSSRSDAFVANNRKPSEQPNQISAIQIANRCGLPLNSSHVYRRRKMRALINEIRDCDGIPILSKLGEYFITANDNDFTNATAHAKMNGLSHPVKTANIKTHPQLPTQVDNWACSLKLSHLSDPDTARKMPGEQRTAPPGENLKFMKNQLKIDRYLLAHFVPQIRLEPVNTWLKVNTCFG